MSLFCFFCKKNLSKNLSVVRVLVFSIFISIFSAQLIFAEKTPVKDLYQYNLENGLSLFVVENHTVPLVYIEIAVRAGAVSQTAENAGLFHLYEHMMFKGNALYQDSASFDRAMSDMGSSSRNGSTGIDCVNYFFTIPSNELERGLAFWNAAIRAPLMKPDEFENEKKVVLAEIEGRKSNPGTIFSYYKSNAFFSDEPYRLDPGGSYDSISNATIEQLREIQMTYYIPSNAALFVGGDVNPDEVFSLVKKIYGNWSDEGRSVPERGVKQNASPFAKYAGNKNAAKFAVMPYDRIAPGVAQVSVDFRGPDSDFDLEDTYVADYLLQILNDPTSSFKQSLVKNEVLGIPDVDYAWASYATVRASGILDFGSMIVSPENNLVERVNLFWNEIQNNLLHQIAEDKSLYKYKKRKEITRVLSDESVLRSQTATGLLGDLRFWWTCASDDYYYTYSKNLRKVRQKHAVDFIDKYITGKIPLVTVLVNPAIYELYKNEFEKEGFELITAENAYWFNNERFAGSSQKKESTASSVTDYSQYNENIYKPSAASSSGGKNHVKNPIVTKELANGIPVYVEQVKGSQVSSVYVAVRGGIANLTRQTSGLENALFSMMSMSSKKYDYAARQKISHEKNASVGTFSRVAGSAISATSINKYFYDLIDVLGDSVVNPHYDDNVYDLLMTEYYQSIQSMLNDPQSLLSYEISNTLYENHPYHVRSQVMPFSIDQITAENMKSLYDKIITPENMVVVAVGDINVNKLVRKLNKTVGKIKSNGMKAVTLDDLPQVNVSGEPVILTHPSVTGTGHVERVFRSPVPTSEDYVPSEIASDIYSDILYSVVRERRGVCYTPQSFVSESKAPTGAEYLYRVSDFAGFAKYMKEARGIMAEGRMIESTNADGSYSYSKISDNIESYKNSYINQMYESKQTVSSVASSLTYNLLQYDDLEFSEKKLDRVYDTTADDVLRVFKKYWVDAPARWFVIVGPENSDLKIKD